MPIDTSHLLKVRVAFNPLIDLDLILILIFFYLFSAKMNGRRSFDSSSAYMPSTTLTNSPRLAPNATHNSDFVFSKLRTPLSVNKKQYPDLTPAPTLAAVTKSPMYTPSSPKRSVHDAENNKPHMKNSVSSYGGVMNVKKSSLFNGVPSSTSAFSSTSTYGGLDSGPYTPTGSTYRSVIPQQTFGSSNSNSTYSKPYSSFAATPSYSKASKLMTNASFSGLSSNKYYPFNSSSYTGMKREKLRTGF